MTGTRFVVRFSVWLGQRGTRAPTIALSLLAMFLIPFAGSPNQANAQAVDPIGPWPGRACPPHCGRGSSYDSSAGVWRYLKRDPRPEPWNLSREGARGAVGGGGGEALGGYGMGLLFPEEDRRRYGGRGPPADVLNERFLDGLPGRGSSAPAYEYGRTPMPASPYNLGPAPFGAPPYPGMGRPYW